jgi:hypothetical protein
MGTPGRRRRVPERERVRRRLSAACLALLLGVSATANANEPYRIVVLERVGSSELEQEASSRLKAELRSLEFEVVSLPLELVRDPHEAVDVDGSELQPSAVVVLAAQGSGLRLWMSDRISHELTVQDWPEDALRGAATIALQGVELVRARLTSPLVPAQPTQDVAPRAVPARPLPSAPGPRFGLQLGVGVAFEPSADRSAYLPLVRLFVMDHLRSFGTEVTGALRLGAGGFGPALALEAVGGGARISETFVLADALLELGAGAPLRPFVALGFGVDHRHIEGTGAPGYVGQTSDVLRPIASVGLGLSAELFGPFGLSVEAQCLLAAEPAQIRIGSVDAATLGHASMLLSATLVLLP